MLSLRLRDSESIFSFQIAVRSGELGACAEGDRQGSRGELSAPYLSVLTKKNKQEQQGGFGYMQRALSRTNKLNSDVLKKNISFLQSF